MEYSLPYPTDRPNLQNALSKLYFEYRGAAVLYKMEIMPSEFKDDFFRLNPKQHLLGFECKQQFLKKLSNI